MVNSFRLKEYDKVVLSPAGPPRQIEHGVCLPRGDFTALKKVLLEAGEASRDGETSGDAAQVLKLRSWQGQEAIQVQNYAGVILLPSGDCLEILPKIYSRDDADDSAAGRVLLKMLSVLPDSPFKSFDKALLGYGKLPLLEVFIIHFLQDVGRLIRRGISSDYVLEQENLNFLRGKLLLKEHILHNSVRRDKFYVAYDEFLPDRPENRLVKSTLLAVLKVARNGASRINCKQYLSHFERVGRAGDVTAEFAKCRKDRNMQHYARVLEWCKILLSGHSPLPSSGKFGCQSILFPMHKLFENYVAVKMRSAAMAAGWKFTPQLRGHYLIEEHGEKKFSELKPDMFFVKAGQSLIADTKWKVIASAGDIKESDLYQMFAYTEKILLPESKKLCFLVYPKTSQSPGLKPFYFRAHHSELRAVWYDLETDECELAACLA